MGVINNFASSILTMQACLIHDFRPDIQREIRSVRATTYFAQKIAAYTEECQKIALSNIHACRHTNRADTFPSSSREHWFCRALAYISERRRLGRRPSPLLSDGFIVNSSPFGPHDRVCRPVRWAGPSDDSGARAVERRSGRIPASADRGVSDAVFQPRPNGRLTYGAHQITFAMKYGAAS